MKKTLIGIAVLALIFAGGVWWSKSLQQGDTGLIATKGIHWHTQLEIYVKGVKQDIPANVGIGATHQPIHTHDEDAAQGAIHLEFGGRVTKDDVKLGNFFRIWGKDIRSFGDGMTMTVNGEANTEFDNYQMRDKDKIELRYE